MEPQITTPVAEADVQTSCKKIAVRIAPADKRIVLLIAILAATLTQFDITAVNIALPVIGAEFHMDAVSLSWITTGYLFATAVFLVSIGRVADIYGRKQIYLYGIAIFTTASLFMIVAPSTELLISVRLIQGLGAAMIFGTGLSILTSVCEPEERGKILGIYIAFAYIGMTIAPFLGGIRPSTLAGEASFLLTCRLVTAACLLILWKLKGDWAECAGERFDLTGAVIYAFALILLMTGFSIVPNLLAVPLVAAGCVTGLAFALYEMRVPMPVLNMRLITQNRIFAFSSLAGLLNASATFAVTFLLSLDLQYTKGYSPASAGLVLIFQPLAIGVVTPISGRLSDRIEPQILASAGMAFTAAGLFALVFLTDSTSLWYTVACLILIGVGYGLFSSPNVNAIMGSVDKRYYGIANGINGTVPVTRPDAFDGNCDDAFCSYNRPG